MMESDVTGRTTNKKQANLRKAIRDESSKRKRNEKSLCKEKRTNGESKKSEEEFLIRVL